MSDRIAIFGAGKFGVKLCQKLNNAIFFIDNFKAGSCISGVPVISPSELKYRERLEEIDKVIVALSDYYILGDVLLQLKDFSISNIWYADPILWRKYWGKDIEYPDFEKYIYKADEGDKAVLTKTEYHVCNHCNLNCRGCSHFAPIYKESFADIDVFERDVERLGELFSNVLRFRLMGGEPFLNPDLGSFIVTVREVFPNTHLEIVTNGLVLDKVENKIWDVIKKNDCVLNISLYPPTYAIKDKIDLMLSGLGIDHSFGSGLEQYNDSGVIEEFHKSLMSINVNCPQVAAAKCMGNRCHFLRNGKISKCALPLLADDINRVFDTNYVVQESDYVDIFDEAISSWDMVRKLQYATPFCSYCSMEGTERFDWSVVKGRNISDYIIVEK